MSFITCATLNSYWAANSPWVLAPSTQIPGVGQGLCLCIAEEAVDRHLLDEMNTKLTGFPQYHPAYLLHGRGRHGRPDSGSCSRCCLSGGRPAHLVPASLNRRWRNEQGGSSLEDNLCFPTPPCWSSTSHFYSGSLWLSLPEQGRAKGNPTDCKETKLPNPKMATGEGSEKSQNQLSRA